MKYAIFNSVLSVFEEGKKGKQRTENSIGRHRKTEQQRGEKEDADF